MSYILDTDYRYHHYLRIAQPFANVSREGYLTEFSFMNDNCMAECNKNAIRAALYLETAAILSIESVIVVFISIECIRKNY